MPILSCAIAIFGGNAANAAYQPLKNSLNNGACSTNPSRCSFPGFVDAADTDSSTIKGINMLSAYAYQIKTGYNYKISTKVIGVRSTATCQANTVCKNYYVVNASGAIIDDSRLTFSTTNDNCEYTAYNGPAGYGSCGTASVVIKDSTLYNQKLTIRISRCSRWQGGDYSGYCTSPSSFAINIIIAPAWTISLNTDISSTTATPKDSVTWTHQAKQNGPGKTDAASNFSVDHANTTSGYTWTSTVSGTTNFASGRGVDDDYKTVRTEKRTITQDDVGKKLCSRLHATRISGANNNAGNSSSKCVEVPYNWNINLLTELKKTYTASELEPGGKIEFVHKAKQAGPTKTNATANFSVNHPNSPTGVTASWSINPTTPSGAPSNFANGRLPDANFVIVRTESVTITQDHVGKYLCSQIAASRVSSGHTNSGSSTPVCIYIPYQYQLTPQTEYSRSNNTTNYDEDIVFIGEILNRNGNVNGPTKSRSSSWTAFTFIIPGSDKTISSDTANPKTLAFMPRVPAATYNGGNSSNNYKVGNIYNVTVRPNSYNEIGSSSNKNRCAATWNNTTTVFNSGSTTEVCKTNNLADVVNGLQLGDRLCFAVWAANSWAEFATTYSDSKQTSTDRAYSKPSCLTVSKSPQIQLRGADAKSGAAKFGSIKLTDDSQGGFEGVFSSNAKRGSWSQYGLLSSGEIDQFGSTGYTFAQNKNKSCKLHFANTNGKGGSNCNGSFDGNFGQNNRIITLPKVAEYTADELSQQAKEITNSAFNLNGLVSGIYYLEKDAVIEASQLTKNQHLIIVAPAHDITIAGNITASGTYDNLAEIPTLTIIASKIFIRGFTANSNKINQIYGTYVAKERFYTCDKNTKEAFAGAVTYKPTSPYDGLCQNQLTITGAVISRDRPNLWRTAGAGKDDVTTPSEIFKYTPNLYLTPYALSQEGNSNNWTLTDLRQLPGRL